MTTQWEYARLRLMTEYFVSDGWKSRTKYWLAVQGEFVAEWTVEQSQPNADIEPGMKPDVMFPNAKNAHPYDRDTISVVAELGREGWEMVSEQVDATILVSPLRMGDWEAPGSRAAETSMRFKRPIGE